MSKPSRNIRDMLGAPLAGMAVITLSIVVLIGVLWVLMTFVRVVLG